MDHALATWVPTEVLVGALTLALGLLYRLWAKSQKEENERADRSNTRLEAIEKVLIELDKKLGSSVSNDHFQMIREKQGERMGAIERALEVAKDRLERLSK